MHGHFVCGDENNLKLDSKDNLHSTVNELNGTERGTLVWLILLRDIYLYKIHIWEKI